MPQLEFYLMIQSERVATVHKLPLWRILVPDFWNPSGAAYMLWCAHLEMLLALASHLIPPESLAGLFQATVPCLLCAADSGHIQAAELWHWQSHQGCFLLRMLEPGWDGALVRKAPLCHPGQLTPGAQTSLTQMSNLDSNHKKTIRKNPHWGSVKHQPGPVRNHEMETIKGWGSCLVRLNRTKQTWQPKILGSPA